MSEIATYVVHGSSQVTPATLEKTLRNLPMWKVEFAAINAPHFPHLVDQLEFLADVVEDVAEGVYKELPYAALAAAVFALIYAHRKADLIPDSVAQLGHLPITCISWMASMSRTIKPARLGPTSILRSFKSSAC